MKSSGYIREKTRKRQKTTEKKKTKKNKGRPFFFQKIFGKFLENFWKKYDIKKY